MPAPEPQWPADAVRPTFLYVGASKAGSSWIFEILREHPQVFVPPAKDVKFFDVHYDKGIAWYAAFFAPGRDRPARGDISHDYFLAERTADRIHRWLPDVRIVACLRDPVDRIVSAYIYNKTTDLDRDTTLADYAADSARFRQGSYYRNLLPFYERFPREHILVLFYDDLKADPRAFASRLFDFIGVDPTFEPSVLHQVVLPAREPRSHGFALLTYQTALLLRKLGLANLVGAVKRNPWFNALLFKELGEKPAVPETTLADIRARYSADYDALATLVGRTLPDAWYAAPAPAVPAD